MISNMKVMVIKKNLSVKEHLNEIKPYFSRCQIGFETSVKGSKFILIRFSCCTTNVTKHKIKFECGGSYIGSPDWTKKQQQ